MSEDSKPKSGRYDRELSRGALFNGLGMLGKLLHPVGLLVATRLYGVESIAGFLLAIAVTELACGLALSGYTDATTLFLSPLVDGMKRDEADSQRAYRVLSNGIVVGGVLAVVLAAAISLLSPLVVAALGDYAGIMPGLPILIWSLVPRVAGDMSLAATKAHMKMQYHAILRGFAQPLLHISLLTVLWYAGLQVTGLFYAYLLAECVVAAIALCVLPRFFAVKPLAAAIAAFRFDRRMMRFAVPQTFSLTLHNYLLHVDVLMLAALGTSGLMVAWYGTAVRLTRELRAVRIMFSGALAPIFARQHAERDRDAIEETLGRLSRWIASLVLLVALPLAVLRDDILGLFDPRYSGNTAFVLVLLFVPYVSSAFGLLGNGLVFAGHTGIALGNNIVIALLNTVLNLIMIPRWGVMGAAVATLSTQPVLVALWFYEMRKLEQIRWRWKPVLYPHVGLAVCAGLWLVLGDPAGLSSWPLRVGAAAGVLGLFVVGMLALGHPEFRDLARRARPRASRNAG